MKIGNGKATKEQIVITSRHMATLAKSLNKSNLEMFHLLIAGYYREELEGLML